MAAIESAVDVSKKTDDPAVKRSTSGIGQFSIPNETITKEGGL